jgi:hypothetical protein
VAVFHTLTLSADISGRYDNPFDPDQIAVDAEVTTPDGRVVSVPGYYDQPFQLSMRDGREELATDGPAVFRVRFTPTTAGPHSITLTARDVSGTVKSAPLPFTATPAGGQDARGFIRVSKAAPAYFVHDDGSSYFAVGENVCWSGWRRPIADYTKWFDSLGHAGGNWARLWLAFNEKGLEWSAKPTEKPGIGTYQGLGRYALDNAWRLDWILSLAEKDGIRLTYCLGTYGEFKEGGYFNEGAWVSNPYNARNGGPCATPDEFWTNELARKFYKQRLRYAVARWGHSPYVFAWEFWNEVDPKSPAVVAWTSEMAKYLKSIDPNRRLVSTTYGNDAIWQDPNIDFTMSHMYGTADGTADFTDQIRREAKSFLRFGKPYLLAEFGIDWQTGDQKWDPDGHAINMHNGAWASLASGSAGTAMMWYWDSYIDPKNSYKVLTPVRNFADTIDWASHPMRPIDRIEVSGSTSGPETFAALEVTPTVGWGKSPSNHYSARTDGTIDGGPVVQTLGSPGRRGDERELFSEMVWTLDMPQAGEALVRVGDVSTLARLQLSVDGKVVVDRRLEAGEPGKGPWKSSRYQETWKNWVATYDQTIPVPIPAGRHSLTIANAEGDWLQITGLRLPAYLSSRYPQLDALGIADESLGIVWIHDRHSTWQDPYREVPRPVAQEGLTVTLPGMKHGSWQAEWWDTIQGKVLESEACSAGENGLSLRVPTFSRDIVVKFVRRP